MLGILCIAQCCRRCNVLCCLRCTSLWRGKIFVVGANFWRGVKFILHPACKLLTCLNVATSPKRRVYHVVITNSTQVNRHSIIEKYRPKCTGMVGITTVGKCETDASVGRLCVASLWSVPEMKWRIDIWGNIVLLWTQTQLAGNCTIFSFVH
jgi:hypothetical protein